MTYALLETFASKRQGRPLWFARMTGIGPMTTSDPAERAEFLSEEAARQCPAMWHALSFYEPIALDEQRLDLRCETCGADWNGINLAEDEAPCYCDLSPGASREGEQNA